MSMYQACSVCHRFECICGDHGPDREEAESNRSEAFNLWRDVDIDSLLLDYWVAQAEFGPFDVGPDEFLRMMKGKPSGEGR